MVLAENGKKFHFFIKDGLSRVDRLSTNNFNKKTY